MKESNKQPRNILMWLRETDSHLNSDFFHGEKEVAYHKFFKEVSEKNNFRFAFGFDSYTGDATFSHVFAYKDGGLVEAEENFVAEVIYQFNRMVPIGFSVKPAVIRNTSEFKELCNSKIETYKYLKEFFPKTFIAFSKEEILSLLKEIETDKIVLKPNRGKEGDDVLIFSKSEINLDLVKEEKLHKDGFLVQEFIDTSAGIPNIATSYHDLRIITFGDKISLCHVRQPQDGSLISNYHKGASKTEIPIDSIPEFILSFYKKVHSKIIKKYPNPMYSMDIGIGKDGPRLIELNSHTAFPGKDFKCLNLFINNLIEYLESLV